MKVKWETSTGSFGGKDVVDRSQVPKAVTRWSSRPNFAPNAPSSECDDQRISTRKNLKNEFIFFIKMRRVATRKTRRFESHRFPGKSPLQCSADHLLRGKSWKAFYYTDFGLFWLQLWKLLTKTTNTSTVVMLRVQMVASKQMGTDAEQWTGKGIKKKILSGSKKYSDEDQKKYIIGIKKISRGHQSFLGLGVRVGRGFRARVRAGLGVRVGGGRGRGGGVGVGVGTRKVVGIGVGVGVVL